jgi:hypothetical protein
MTQPAKKRWTLFGASLGAIATLVLVAGIAVFATSGAAATKAAPTNTSSPVISGTVQKGQRLHSSSGTWSGTPTITFAYQWRRCDQLGNSCANIGGATDNDYTLTSADVGNTVRSVVTATNSSGSKSAASAQTAVVAAPQQPANTIPPQITGVPLIGQTLTVSNGTWTGPGTITFTYSWRLCDANGGSCAAITGATNASFLLTAADAGHALRARVTARNANGSTAATTVPTQVVAAKANGCPVGAKTIAVADLAPPARLSIDRMQFTPSTLKRSTTSLVARFHVSACGGAPVQGALVYATGVPYNQLNNAGEVATDATGWATVSFHVMAGYPSSVHQQLLAMFVRARQPGDATLGGISTRRLVSAPVRG